MIFQLYYVYMVAALQTINFPHHTLVGTPVVANLQLILLINHHVFEVFIDGFVYIPKRTIA